MKTLFTILTISRVVKRNKRSMKRSIFAISEVVVDLTTILAKIIILPFTMYKIYKNLKQSKQKVAQSKKNVIYLSDYKKKKKIS